MASLVIIYNLCFDFFFFFDVSYWFVFILRGGGMVAQSEKKASVGISNSRDQTIVSHSRFHPCSIYSRLYKKYLQNIISATCQ